MLKGNIILILIVFLSTGFLFSSELSDIAVNARLDAGDLFFGYFEDHRGMTGLILRNKPLDDNNIVAIKIYFESDDANELVFAAIDKDYGEIMELQKTASSSLVFDMKNNERAMRTFIENQVKNNDIINIVYIIEDNSELYEHEVRRVKILKEGSSFGFKTGGNFQNKPCSHGFECICKDNRCNCFKEL